MPKNIGQEIRRARDLYVTKQMTFAEIAKEVGVTTNTVIRWQKNDMKKHKRERWSILRDRYEAEKERKEQHREIVENTKKEIAELTDKEMNRHEQLLTLQKIRNRLMSDEIFNKMTSQAKIRDYLDLVKETNKIT